jgi:hypothetical protein
MAWHAVTNGAIFFSNSCCVRTGNMEFGNYNNYEIWPYQVLGVTCALIIFGIVFSGMAYSKLFNVFMKTPINEEKEPDWVDVKLEMQDQLAATGDYTNMETMEEPVAVPPPDNDYVNASVPDDDYVNANVPDDDYVNASVPDNDYANANVPDDDYVNASVPDNDYVNANVPDDEDAPVLT